MEKLFSDCEVMLNERPTKITEEQEKAYYERLAKEIIDNNWSDSPIERIVQDLGEISWSDSGYEIAKKLEGYTSKASYSIDTPFIEFLDDFDYNKSAILRKNIKDWVKAHNPLPKLKRGQKLIVEIPLFIGQKKGDIIFVTGMDEKEANYYVDENPDRNGGCVITYEKVENNCKIFNHEN